MDTSVQIPEDLKSGHISDGSELKPAEVAARASAREVNHPMQLPAMALIPSGLIRSVPVMATQLTRRD
jgi:hypothetical protein